MHYHVEVYVNADNSEAAAQAAEELLAPFDENEVGLDAGKWDWYQIGGRWRGAHISAEAITDDIPLEICSLCNGTGTRPDAAKFGDAWMEAMRGCNGCNGRGRERPWPTQWPRHSVDICPIEQVRPDLTAHALITPDGQWIELDGRAVPVPDGPCWAVTVDCHS
jgi:hypothetical protein